MIHQFYISIRQLKGHGNIWFGNARVTANGIYTLVEAYANKKAAH